MPGDNRSCLNSRSDSGCLYPRSGRSLQGRAPFAFELDAKPVEGLDLRMDLISWHVDIERNENKAVARLVRLLCREMRAQPWRSASATCGVPSSPKCHRAIRAVIRRLPNGRPARSMRLSWRRQSPAIVGGPEHHRKARQGRMCRSAAASRRLPP
jgi:hypothetical protein